MTLVVCVKQVPDLQSDRRIGPDGRVERAPEDATMNELDEHAVEAALQQSAAAGDETVVALTVGPASASAAVRRALQMGAHEAVHVVDDGIAGADVIGTARVLAAAVRRITAEAGAPVRLVLTGMAALDGLTSMVPAALAAELDLPALTLATELTLDGEHAQVVRDLDDAREVLRAPLPALVTVTDQANEPRYPTFPGIMAARSAEVTTWSLADVGLDVAGAGAAARTRVRVAEPRPEVEDPVLVTDEDGEGGRRLAEYLISRRLVSHER